MKARRHMRILEIIRQEPIGTQEELAEKLKKEGIVVTQATISRDIKELKLAKVSLGDGRYRYLPPSEASGSAHRERLLRILRECVLSWNFSENLVVIETVPATAQGVAEALDLLRFEEVIGTLAGERTVFAVIKPKEAVERFLSSLKELIG